jgi:hypothetical protein
VARRGLATAPHICLLLLCEHNPIWKPSDPPTNLFALLKTDYTAANSTLLQVIAGTSYGPTRDLTLNDWTIVSA